MGIRGRLYGLKGKPRAKARRYNGYIVRREVQMSF